jgi:hypothetical protein
MVTVLPGMPLEGVTVMAAAAAGSLDVDPRAFWFTGTTTDSATRGTIAISQRRFMLPPPMHDAGR